MTSLTNLRQRPALARIAGRWWYVLRYYSASQLTHRALKVLDRQLCIRFSVCGASRSLAKLVVRKDPGFDRVFQGHVVQTPADRLLQRAQAIAAGHFEFLNYTVQFGPKVDWSIGAQRGQYDETNVDGDARSVSALWRFQLHYHEFLFDLFGAFIESADESFSDQGWEFVRDWIERNPLNRSSAASDAWHPYCISRRFPTWMAAWHAVLPNEEIRDDVSGSLAQQARHLVRNLEWDPRGNHLLENIKALTLAGAFFEGHEAQRWLDCAQRIFEEQAREQVLGHGEHFERSPMYHSLMLQAVLDMRDVLQEVQPEYASRCHETAERMGAHLQGILHPDGRIPLLSDSAFDETPDAHVLLERVRWKSEQKCGLLAAKKEESPHGAIRPNLSQNASDEASDPESRHPVPCHTLRLQPDRETGDSAGPRPEGEDVKVDGTHRTAIATKAQVVGDYWTWCDGDDYLIFDAGPVGADSLPAHAHCDLLNIEVSLAGQRVITDSGTSDFHDRKMREYCRSTKAHNVLQVDDAEQCDMWSRFRMGYRGWPTRLVTGSDHGFSWCRATHNAYRRIGVPEVGRWVACRSGGPWIVMDWARGQGERQLTQWLHLHPNVCVSEFSRNDVKLALNGVRCRISFLTPGELSIEPGHYCPELGKCYQAPVLKLTTRTKLPGLIAWSLVREQSNGSVRVRRDEAGRTELIWNDGVDEFAWQPVGEL